MNRLVNAGDPNYGNVPQKNSNNLRMLLSSIKDSRQRDKVTYFKMATFSITLISLIIWRLL